LLAAAEARLARRSGAAVAPTPAHVDELIDIASRLPPADLDLLIATARRLSGHLPDETGRQ
jgi:hypothetical protein